MPKTDLEPVRKKVIFLNGANFSGKSSVAKCLQNKLPEPHIHYQFEKFMESLPHKHDAESFNNMANGFLKCIEVMLESGNNLIVEHIILNENMLKNVVDLLHDYKVVFVKVYCPLDVLKKREEEKYSKVKGVVEKQFSKVYQDYVYDLEFDTSKQSSDEISSKIVDFYLNNEPVAFSVLEQKI